jgi:FixJ family two-component response regulator
MEFALAGPVNKQIASEMSLSEITVEIYRGLIMKKMNTRSVADPVGKAEATYVAPHHPKPH